MNSRTVDRKKEEENWAISMLYERGEDQSFEFVLREFLYDKFYCARSVSKKEIGQWETTKFVHVSDAGSEKRLCVL